MPSIAGTNNTMISDCHNLDIDKNTTNTLLTSDIKKIIRFGKGKEFVYNRNITCHEIIELQAKKTPNYIALVYNQKKLTYQQLNEKANQLAHYLVLNGLKKESSVAIYLEPSLETIISILAILKTGCCYIPLDITYPIDRLNFMLVDSNATILLTNQKLSNTLNVNHQIQVIKIDAVNTVIRKQLSTNLDFDVSPENTAYIIYTSGSTGTPKGVKIHHRAINNHMAWMQDQFKFNPADNFLFKTPFSFDPSVWEIFLPLHIGAKLFIAPHGAHLDPYQLCKLVIKYKITVLQMVPTLLQELLKQKNIHLCCSLRDVFVGGESLPTHTKKLFFETLACYLHNLYGPTEATIDISFHTVKKTEFDFATNVIGKPIYNSHLYVLKPDMSICQIEEPGELHIASDSLSRGYHNQPTLTNEKFITPSFSFLGNSKIYKTGDIVKWLPNGLLEYIGRNNDQIKVNGVRIETNEIISRVLINNTVANCVIVKKTDHYKHNYLACYMTAKEKQTIDINQIKQSLKNFFPAFMLPKGYFIIPEIPLTVNGKIDLETLEKLNIADIDKNRIQQRACASFEEVELVKIWEHVLQIKSVDINDDFFDLGGHSLLALQLLECIQKEFGILLKVSDLFISPTISSQSQLIQNLRNKKTNKKSNNLLNINPIIPLATEGNHTPLFLIHPVGGTIFWYTLLAKFMGNTRPIYGIQDPGIELKNKIFSSIKDMAVFYSALIKKTQPTGPYIIGGASFGATVAIEVCNLLQAQGEIIEVIPILDGWGVYPDTLRNDNYFRESMKRQQADLHTQFAQYGLTESKNLLTLQTQRLNLLWDYHLSEIKHKIVLFKAKEMLPVFKSIDDKFNHWNKFTKQKITCYKIPGNHETMFQKHNVKVLAKLLNEYLIKPTD